MTGRAALVLALAVAAGCAPLRDRVVLLPGADGRTGALVVKTGQGETVLATAYSSVEVEAGRSPGVEQGAAPDAFVKPRSPAVLRGAEVRERYAALLQAQPRAPITYMVYFVSGKSELVPDSKALLDSIKAAIAAAPAADIVVTGHTDRVGREQVNDRLSLRRAHAVRDALVAIGIDAAAIEVAGRGERDWVVPTEDQIPELKNRRVEIKIR